MDDPSPLPGCPLRASGAVLVRQGILVVALGRGQRGWTGRTAGFPGTHLLGSGHGSEARGTRHAQSCEEDVSSGGAATPAPGSQPVGT